jgi:hypothetical protein
MSRAPRPIDLMTTLERVNVPSAVVDRSGTVTWQNRAATETAGDLVGRASRAYTRDHSRHSFCLQVDPVRMRPVRRETSRVSFLMYPFCVRG